MNKWKNLLEQYQNNHTRAIYQYGKEFGDLQDRVDAIHNAANKWFVMIEAGIANLVQPDITEPRPSDEEATRLITLYDNFTSDEVEFHATYWRDQGLTSEGMIIDTPSRFNELVGASRIAFAQDIWRAIRQQFPEEEDES